MLDILIVEDEKIEREAISKLMEDCFNDQIHSMVSVSNGEQALQEVQLRSYQLIITDINIPCMNGLQLLHEVKKLTSNIRSIILTGYDYFEYAQEAIRIGVDDFILKPSTQKELCERIAKVIQSVESDKNGEALFNTDRFNEIQSILQSDLIYAILYNASQHDIERYLVMLRVQAKCAFCISMNREDVTKHQLMNILALLHRYFTNCYYEMYFEWTIIFVFHNELISDIKLFHDEDHEFQSYYEKHLFGIGGIKTNINDFHQSYLEAKDQLEHSVSSNHNEHFLESFRLSPMEDIANNLLNLIRLNHVNITSHLAKRICEISVHSVTETVEEVIVKVLEILCHKMKETSDLTDCVPLLESHMRRVSPIASNQSIMMYVNYELSNVVHGVLEERSKSMNKAIKDAYRYISENYYKPIGLNDLANYLELTPQYVSSLFSQHTKNSFTNVLAEYRVEIAKQLLLKQKIKEVASIVGFQNQNYFAKTFKKITGYTPREYREYYGER